MKTSDFCARAFFPLFALATGLVIAALLVSCAAPAPKSAAAPPYLGRGLKSLFTVASRQENQPRRTNVVLFSLPASSHSTSTGLLVVAPSMTILQRATNVPPLPPFVLCNTNSVTFVASGNSNSFVTYRNVIFKARQ
jgi:hypothetical protein